MRILIVDTYYPAFLEASYRSNQRLSKDSYSVQWHTLMQQCFGTADFYSRNLRILGHEATEIVSNCESLQRTWASEQGLRLSVTPKKRQIRGIPALTISRDWQVPVLLAQIESYTPDVVHFQDPGSLSRSTLLGVKALCPFVSCQIASPAHPGTPFDLFDLVFSSFPHFVAQFRSDGIVSSYFQLGFEPSILSRLQSITQAEAVFVGGFSGSHIERIRFFEAVALIQEFDWWGYGIDELEPTSPLRRVHKGPAWGLAMYEKLRGAKICLNNHIDVAREYANNMRLYEATGVGSMLLTDDKVNLSCIFEPGDEVATYANPTDCARKIRYYLEHDDERVQIAAAGQMRTMNEHTYAHRMREFLDLLGEHLS
jgi:hypothetical protein